MFQNDLLASYNEVTGVWTVQRALVFQSKIAGVVRVPKGFKTDLASVPRLPFAYLVAGGTANSPAVVHDYLLVKGVERATADKVFKEAMESTGVPWWRRWLMFGAVRVYGMFA